MEKQTLIFRLFFVVGVFLNGFVHAEEKIYPGPVIYFTDEPPRFVQKGDIINFSIVLENKSKEEGENGGVHLEIEGAEFVSISGDFLYIVGYTEKGDTREVQGAKIVELYTAFAGGMPVPAHLTIKITSDNGYAIVRYRAWLRDRDKDDKIGTEAYIARYPYDYPWNHYPKEEFTKYKTFICELFPQSLRAIIEAYGHEYETYQVFTVFSRDGTEYYSVAFYVPPIFPATGSLVIEKSTGMVLPFGQVPEEVLFFPAFLEYGYYQYLSTHPINRALLYFGDTFEQYQQLQINLRNFIEDRTNQTYWEFLGGTFNSLGASTIMYIASANPWVSLAITGIGLGLMAVDATQWAAVKPHLEEISEIYCPQIASLSGDLLVSWGKIFIRLDGASSENIFAKMCDLIRLKIGFLKEWTRIGEFIGAEQEHIDLLNTYISEFENLLLSGEDANHWVSENCKSLIDNYRGKPINNENTTFIFSINENTTLIFIINATDPNGETITYSAQNLPSGATFSSQIFAWTPSYNQAGSYQVTFIASDGQDQDSETITITVNNVNRPPVLGAIANQSVDENSLLSFSVDATDLDGQALTYSVSGLPAGAVFASQTFSWTPSYDQAGTYSVTFTADDGQAQDSQTIIITVNNVNRTPVLAAINNQSVWVDDPLTFTIDATDPDGDTVTYSAGTLPSGATFTSQDFDWTPSPGQVGSYDVTFIASDGQLQDSETITITVNNVNRPPVLGAISDQSVNENALLSFSVNAIDPDGDTVTYSAGTLPSGATFTSQDFDWTPSYAQAGTYLVTFFASDGQLQDSETITITVNNINPSPILGGNH